jgi:zinc transport system ATP-binding protein
LLLDEPTSSIDISGQKDIYELLLNLNKTMAIVVVSHDISILLNYARNVAHINKNIVFHTLEDVKKQIKNDEHICEVELIKNLKSCSC